MKVKEESEKGWLKTPHSESLFHGIWSHHFMANRWRNSGNSVRLYCFGLQNHCRCLLKPCLLDTPCNKSYDQNRQHIKKQRHYFADKGLSSQGYSFCSNHVWMWMWEVNYKESWALKNWCFWSVVWRRLLRVPWTARRSSQSILKEISPEYSLEGLMLKLKLQCFGHLM